MAKSFKDLSEREILALAISLEEEDGRIYGEFAEKLRTDYPATARMLGEMQAEEAGHRDSLIELFRSRFGDHIPMIRRSDVKGFVSRPPVWLLPNIGPNTARRAVESMESETRRFYHLAADRASDASTRQLLGTLAAAEEKHSEAAEAFEKREITQGVRTSESEAQRRAFVLQF